MPVLIRVIPWVVMTILSVGASIPKTIATGGSQVQPSTETGSIIEQITKFLPILTIGALVYVLFFKGHQQNTFKRY